MVGVIQSPIIVSQVTVHVQTEVRVLDRSLAEGFQALLMLLQRELRQTQLEKCHPEQVAGAGRGLRVPISDRERCLQLRAGLPWRPVLQVGSTAQERYQVFHDWR